MLLLVSFIALVGSFVLYQRYGETKSTTVSTKNETIPVKEISYEDLEGKGVILTDIPINKSFEFTFSRKLDQKTINQEMIKVFESGSRKEVTITPELTGTGDKIIIQPPKGNYQPGTNYEITIGEIRFEDGGRVGDPYLCEFITEREEHEEGTINSELIPIKEEQIKDTNANTIKLSKELKNLDVDNIIIIPSDDVSEGQALKIKSIDKGITSVEVEVVQPEFGELYEKLNINKIYDIQPEHIHLVEGINGVTIEDLASIPFPSMVASENSEKKGDYELPKLSADITNGIKFNFEDVPVGKGKKKIFLNGTAHLYSPKVSADIDMGFLSVKKFNLVVKSKEKIDISIRTPEIEKGDSFYQKVGELKKSVKLNKLTEKIRLANVTIPTSVPGLLIEGSFNIKITYNYKFQPEVSLSFDFVEEKGFVYNGKKIKPVNISNADLDVAFNGTGDAQSKIGPSLNIGVTGFKVIAGGIEGFGGVKLAGEFFGGINADKGRFGCLKYSANGVLEGSIYLDIFKERIGEYIFAEKYIPPSKTGGNCERFKKLILTEKEITLKASQSIDVPVIGSYEDISIQKSKESNLSDFDLLTVESSDNSTVTVAKGENLIKIIAPANPSSEQATVKLVYTENGVTSEEKINLKITDIPRELSRKEIKKITTELYDGIRNSFIDLGMKHQWNNERNPADFNILSPALRNYATEKFTNGYLKDLSNDYYCDCDAWMFPIVDFDIRMDVIENTPQRIVVSGIEFDSMIFSGGTLYLTIIRDGENWLIDDWKYVSNQDKKLNVTVDEYLAHLERSGEGGSFVKEITHNGRKVYVSSLDGLTYEGIFADTSEIIFDIPIEWLQ